MSRRRKLLAVLGGILFVIAVTTPVGLAVHIVDARKARSDALVLQTKIAEAQLATLKQTTAEICASQNQTAVELNRVLDYVRSAGEANMRISPAARAFLDGLPHARVRHCST